jgi:hypothetical protein
MKPNTSPLVRMLVDIRIKVMCVVKEKWVENVSLELVEKVVVVLRNRLKRVKHQNVPVGLLVNKV